jgi:hypothetical protein
VSEVPPDTFWGMFDSEITQQLVDTDTTAMSPQELKAHLALVDERIKQLNVFRLGMLEESPELVAQHPRLQELLDHLRTLDL